MRAAARCAVCECAGERERKLPAVAEAHREDKIGGDAGANHKCLFARWTVFEQVGRVWDFIEGIAGCQQSSLLQPGAVRGTRERHIATEREQAKRKARLLVLGRRSLEQCGSLKKKQARRGSRMVSSSAAEYESRGQRGAHESDGELCNTDLLEARGAKVAKLMNHDDAG